MPLKQILDFSANINPLGPSPKALRRLRRDLPLIRFYPDTETRELRDLIANEASISSDCILFGNGATPLLHLVPRVLKPRTAVVPEPSFSEYSSALERQGCRIHRLVTRAEEGFQIHREELFHILRRARPDLLILGNPNNPTGSLVPRPLLSELIDVCSERRIYLVLDESFIDFTQHPSCVVDAAKNPRVLVVRSLTKFWALPGLRIGYLVAHRSLVEKLSAGSEPWPVNILASAAAAESLRDLQYREQTVRLIHRERAFLMDQLARLRWLHPLPSEANFLLVRIGAPSINSTLLCEKLAKRNILVRDGSNFPGLDRRYFRVAVRRRSENQRLIEELRAISSTTEHRKRNGSG